MKTLNDTLASQLNKVILGNKAPSKLTPAVAVQLTQLGCLGFEDGKVTVTKRGRKLVTKWCKAVKAIKTAELVRDHIKDVLTDKGAVTQHRAVWEALGRDKFSRDEILIALRDLRTIGFLKSIKKSNNNFQVFWTLAQDEAEPAAFSTNG